MLPTRLLAFNVRACKSVSAEMALGMGYGKERFSKSSLVTRLPPVSHVTPSHGLVVSQGLLPVQLLRLAGEAQASFMAAKAVAPKEDSVVTVGEWVRSG